MSVAAAVKELNTVGVHRDTDMLPSGFSHYINRMAYNPTEVETLRANMSKYCAKSGFNREGKPAVASQVLRWKKEGKYDDNYATERVKNFEAAVEDDFGQQMYGYMDPSKDELEEAKQEREYRVKVDTLGYRDGGGFKNECGFGAINHVKKETVINEALGETLDVGLLPDEEAQLEAQIENNVEQETKARRYDRGLAKNQALL